MSIEPANVERLVQVALTAIKEAHGTEEDEYGATLFVSHHLDELEGAYWEEHLGTSSPDPIDVLNLLVRSPHWEPDGDRVEAIDVTLPGEVTQYLLCVRFDTKGTVVDISMES